MKSLCLGVLRWMVRLAHQREGALEGTTAAEDDGARDGTAEEEDDGAREWRR